MNRPNRLVILALGLLLFAAPAAWDCGELAAMTSGCPMTQAVGASTCHGSGAPSMECCQAQPATGPMLASLSQGAKPFVVLEIPSLPSVLVQAPRAASPGTFRAARAQERFALYAAYLL